MQLAADHALATAVTDVIRGGDVVRLRELLSANDGLARAVIVDPHGTRRTMLHIATDWPGHFPNVAAIIALLIEQGADPNAAVEGGVNRSDAETPLHWAASSDDVDALDALLDGGADIEAPGAIFTGGAAMSDAVVFAQWNAARRLLERGARTTLWQSAALGLLDRVRADIASDPAPSSRDITNALWHACRGGQRETAAFLLQQGGDLHWVGYDGKTPLDVAQESGGSELVASLRAASQRSG